MGGVPTCKDLSGMHMVPPDMQLSKLIGDYGIGSQVLGRGAMCRVYEACLLASGKKVAVKVFDRVSLEADCQAYHRSLRELKIWGALAHPNLIALRRILKSPRWLYAFMEKADRELKQWTCNELHLSPCPVDEAIAFFVDILLGLCYMHDLGVAHRDIKLENIMYNVDTHTAKLADFGFACVLTHAPHPSEEFERYLRSIDAMDTSVPDSVPVPQRPTVIAALESETRRSKCGSPYYAAPELFDARTEWYSPFQADIFSLGVCLYALLVGRLPFHTVPPGEAVRNGLQEVPASVPADLHHLLWYMCHAVPEYRPSVRQIMRHPRISIMLARRLSSLHDQTSVPSAPKVASSCVDDYAQNGSSLPPQASPLMSVDDSTADCPAGDTERIFSANLSAEVAPQNVAALCTTI